MVDIDYDRHRFGFAEFGSSETAKKAGLHNAKQGLFLGYDNASIACRSKQQAPILLVGGARSGKGNHIIPWLVDGAIDSHVISMDWKGQNGAISQLQHHPEVRVINWAPRGCDFPTHKINPLSYLRSSSPTLVGDAKLFSRSWIPFTGSKDGEFFQASAQRYVEAVIVHYAELHGEVDLPGLADLMEVFASDAKAWTDFEESMEADSSLSFVRSVAIEISGLRMSDNPNAGGLAGIIGEILKQFSCMSDPQIRETVSPPFDFDFSELADPKAHRTQVNIMEAMEFAQTSAPIVKALYTAALVYKRRSLRARPQLWVLDEIGNIGSWNLAVELGTFGPGYGIRPAYIVQSITQLENLAKRASVIIPNSCGTQIYKGIRDYNEALRISNMLGSMTVPVTDAVRDDKLMRQVGQLRMQQEFGGDPFNTQMAIEDLQEQIGLTTPVSRQLLTPSEIMNIDKNECILFMPGQLKAPMILRIPDYWTRRDLAGRYLGDPFHDEDGTVSIADGKGGARKAQIIAEDVPVIRSSLPQHKHGKWHYVAGLRP